MNDNGCRGAEVIDQPAEDGEVTVYATYAGVNEDENAYPDYSGNAHKNVAKAPTGGKMVPKSAKFAIGVNIKPLTVAQLLDIMKQGLPETRVMFIQRKMHGERSSSRTLDYAHPFRLGNVKEGAKAVVLFDEISFPVRRAYRVNETPSVVGDILAELEKLTPSASEKGIGLASYSNRGQAIRAIYDAYFKEGRFYMEVKQNTVG